MRQIKVGIVGIGHMGSFHADSLYTNKVENALLHSVMDIDQERLIAAQKYEDVKIYDQFSDFISDEELDAVIIATPHYDHPTIGIEVLKHKKHLLIEKPAGVFTKNVRELNQLAQHSDKVFSIMLNQRTNPLYIKIKEMIDLGLLGELRRVNWIVTNWYRSSTYYESGGWRATWEKEGGGVLLNQAPHQIDLLQWIFGMPKSVQAFMKFGAHRNITVENDVTAYLEYPNGATGVFITSTFDTPGTNRLEAIGSKGKIVVENGQISWHKLEMDEADFDKLHHENNFAAPKNEKVTFDLKENQWGVQHLVILNNFVDSIVNKTNLIAPGEEGVKGLSISNAMHLSAFLGQKIELDTLDEDLFITELKLRIDSEK
ncbi:MAG: Gfo/Idh/MocA family oxidoreductase [Firmicutes bacterium]|nr:Gfo/Idh/MocA family oxidoreductase [Bacillota bacterium]